MFFSSILCGLHVHYYIIKEWKCYIFLRCISWFYKFKKKIIYKIESIYMDFFIWAFIFYSNSFLVKNYWKLRILEKTAVLRYSLVTQIKAAGTGDHWKLTGIRDYQKSKISHVHKNFFSASLFTSHCWRFQWDGCTANKIHAAKRDETKWSLALFSLLISTRA